MKPQNLVMAFWISALTVGAAGVAPAIESGKSSGQPAGTQDAKMETGSKATGGDIAEGDCD